ncbi:MAG: aldo/keto reductase [Saprospiraceae bacterium]|jgi:voltage-dependent potassium channel beta subunit|nr:aldo/keto reductase [Saprospiraceae bacterium]
MEYRKLGKTGLPVSALSFGSWITFGNQIGDDVAERLMVKAYEAGINFFDNAEIYASGKSERVMGKILKNLNWDRSSYIVSSKVYFGDGGKLPTQRGLHRKHLFEACHAALDRLQVEYLDLFFCHRPDKSTPIEETVFAMNHLIQQGKIFYWGTSEWSAMEIMEAHMVAKANNLIGPSMEQPQYNMLCRDKVEVEYAQIYKTVGLGTTIWSPLASGLFTTKYHAHLNEETRLTRAELEWLKEKNLTEENIQLSITLNRLAKELGFTLSQMAIAWCLNNPNVSTVILGASKESQLEENLKSLEILPLLTPEIIAKIEEILKNKPVHPPF